MLSWETLKRDPGFTLIELLITISIVGFVITAVYSFYLTGLKSWQQAVDQTEYQQSARIALDKIVRELTDARDFTIRDQGREIRFQIPGDNRILRFRKVGPQLVFDVFPTTDPGYYHNVVALGITELNFENNSSGLINVRLGTGTFNPKNGEARETFCFLTSKIAPRNLPSAPLGVPANLETAEENDDEIF